MANALVWVFFALCNNPVYQEKCVEEITRVVNDPSGAPTYEELSELKMVEAVFKEATRLHTVIGALPPRKVFQPTVLGGYPIAVGTDVLVSTDLIHHDPKVW
jgi:cytochrome P450